MADDQAATLFSDDPSSVSAAAEVRRRLVEGRLLVLAPHMDDETLGCGGTMALHADQSQVFCLFATDGSRSPTPLLPWTGKPHFDLARRRRLEAVSALADIGVPQQNLLFLDLPDGRLKKHHDVLIGKLQEALDKIQPEIVLAPFRLDVHPDHIALNRAIRIAMRSRPAPAVLLEYFVYFRLRLLPGGDIRTCLPPQSLLQIDTSTVSRIKARALSRYQSQTRIQHDWQDRPILTADRVRERCETPEQFFPSDPGSGLLTVFQRHRLRIFIAYLAERLAKRPKDQLIALLRWLFRMENP
jgi:LmbE family N-acetylglucosaminyl deacetylase